MADTDPYKIFAQRMGILADTIDNAADTSAQDALMQANRDLITGWRWTAVLEFGVNGRGTCLSCAGLDGTLYPVGEGPSMPLHSDCRCFKTPVTYFQDIGLDGSQFDELTGAYLGRWKEGEIRGDYDEWFAGHADRNPEALKKMLGPNRYALYESGQMSFSDFVNPVTGRRWTLAEIAAGAKGAIGPGGVAVAGAAAIESAAVAAAFVPASTIAEAEQWLKNNMGKGDDYGKGQRFSHPEFQRNEDHMKAFKTDNLVLNAQSLDIDSLNVFNSLVDESNDILDKMGVPRLRCIVFKDQEVSSMGDGVLVYGQGKLLKNNADRIKDVPTWKLGDDIKNAPAYSYDNFTKWSTASRATFWHEIGHHVHQEYKVSGSRVMEIEMKKTIKSKVGRMKVSPTQYATTKNEEWFAENFALLKMGRADLVHPLFTEIAGDVLKKGGLI